MGKQNKKRTRKRTRRKISQRIKKLKSKITRRTRRTRRSRRTRRTRRSRRTRRKINRRKNIMRAKMRGDIVIDGHEDVKKYLHDFKDKEIIVKGKLSLASSETVKARGILRLRTSRFLTRCEATGWEGAQEPPEDKVDLIIEDIGSPEENSHLDKFVEGPNTPRTWKIIYTYPFNIQLLTRRG